MAMRGWRFGDARGSIRAEAASGGRQLMINRAWIAVLALALAGNTVAGSIWKTGITEEDFQKKVDAGSVLKPLVKTHFDPRPAGTKIEVYYKRFSIMHLA